MKRTSFLVVIQPVHSKGDESWVFFGRTDAKAGILILWPLHGKSWVIGKDSDAGKYWGQEEKGMTEDEMAGWHHRLDGREFGWTPGVGDGQGGLACCNSWVAKSWTQLSDWTELIILKMASHVVLGNCSEEADVEMWFWQRGKCIEAYISVEGCCWALRMGRWKNSGS